MNRLVNEDEFIANVLHAARTDLVDKSHIPTIMYIIGYAVGRTETRPPKES